MIKRFCGVAILLVSVTAAFTQNEHLRTRPALPPEEMLERLNLTRAWQTRVAVESLRDGLFSIQMLPHNGSLQLIVQTRRGAVIALDAETGDLLWQTQAGQPYWPGQPVAFNSRALYVVRREFLYALDRNTGRHVYETIDARTKQRTLGVQLPSAPSAAPVADDRMLYIPLGARIQALELPLGRPQASMTPEEKLALASRPRLPEVKWDQLLLGLRIEQPLLLAPPPQDKVAGTVVAAVSPNGVFFSLSGVEKSSPLLYKAGFQVAVPMGQYDQFAYLVSENATVHALNIRTGDLAWRFDTEKAVWRRPAVTAKDVFVSPERLGLFRVDRDAGISYWLNRDAARFLATNQQFVYAADAVGNLLVLDYFRGTTLAAYDLRDYTYRFPNELTDRIYLGSNDGRIVCLRYRGQKTPLLNKLPPPPPPKIKPKAKDVKPEEKEEPDAGAWAPHLLPRFAASQCEIASGREAATRWIYSTSVSGRSMGSPVSALRATASVNCM